MRHNILFDSRVDNTYGYLTSCVELRAMSKMSPRIIDQNTEKGFIIPLNFVFGLASCSKKKRSKRVCAT